MRPLKWLLSVGIFGAVIASSSIALWGCGGGGGGGSGTAPPPPPPQNVANITIDSFNGNSAGNTAYVTVTVCAPGTTNCATIDHISVDTGSFGLRLLSSAIDTYNTDLLSALPNVLTTGEYLAECAQ